MTLSVSRVVNVSVSLSPQAAQKRGFGTLCILGDSGVLNDSETLRFYNGADEVATDFGVDAPEYLAATCYFSQSPKPKELCVAQWRNAPTPAALMGGTPSQISELQISGAGFKITIDSEVIDVTDLDTSKAVSVENVASLITAKLGGKGACTVVDGRFVITSAKPGSASKITVASVPSSGTDMSSLLALTEETGAKVVAGKDDTETVTDALSRLLLERGRDFYGLVLATTQKVEDNAIIAIAQQIEASDDAHVFGVTLTDEALKNTAYSEEAEDVASKLKRGEFSRTAVFYADFAQGDSAYRVNPYFAASAFGRMFSVNFEGSKTTLTLKFKKAPTIQPSNLNVTEVKNLEDRNINVYATYANGTTIIEQGVMASGQFADERHGLDWLQDAVQTAVFNCLYQSKTKIPQTRDGVAMIQASIENILAQGVANGLIAPGKWTSDAFGNLETGDYLPSGYYVYANDLDEQDQADREARKCPPLQCAVKLAGAIHSVDITLNINR